MFAASRIRLLVTVLTLGLVGAGLASPGASAASAYPLIAAQVPAYSPNHYAFDLVVHSRNWSPAAGKAANPRAVWIMTGVGGATYGQIIIDSTGFNSSRCLLRHADGSGWSGPRPFNMTLPDCTDFIADNVAARARSYGLYSQPWDGIYQDSLSYHPYQFAVRTAGGMTNVDADLDGKADSQLALESAWKTGMRRYTARLRANLPGKIVHANGADWGNTSDLDGVDGNAKEHWIDYIMSRQNGVTVKSLVDAANRWYAVSTGRARLYSTVSYWKTSTTALPTDARQQMETSPDAQRRMRFGLTTSLMAGIHYDFQYSRLPGSSAIYDEYRGGDLDRQGYLGEPTGPARQLSSGVWRRDFQNGVALTNENGFAVSLDLSGQQLRRLKGTEAPTVNSGALAGLVTLPALDGIILRRDGTTAPPPAPTVAFVGVTDGQTVSGTVNWQASTTSGGGTITKVEFSVDGVVRSTDTTSPYQYGGTGSWDSKQFADGVHALGLKLTLSDGRIAEALASVTVKNAVSTAPTVAFVGVADGQTLTGTANWQAATTAGGGTITKVDFSVDGVVRSTDLTSPYEYGGTGSWDTTQVADGGHTLGLFLTLSDGRSAQASISVTVTNAVIPPPATTLAPNTSFESDPVASYTTHGPGGFQWASTIAHSGSRSLSIVGSSAGMSRWLSKTTAIAAVAGRTYNVSAFFRTKDVPTTAPARLAVTFFTSSGAYISGSALESTTLTGVRDWTQLTRIAVAPAGTAYIRVEFRLGGAGTLWVDDLSVTSP